MTAREDQAEPVIGLALANLDRRLDVLVDLVRQLCKLPVEDGVTPQLVERLKATRRHQPSDRISWHAEIGPLRGARQERIVQRLLREIEIAEEADQRRKHPAPVATIERLEPSLQVYREVRRGTMRRWRSPTPTTEAP